MSSVTSVIVLPGDQWEADSKQDKLLRALLVVPHDEDSPSDRLVRIDVPSGSKVSYADLYAGTFNGFDVAGFLGWLQDLPWYRLSNVRVLTLHENADRWTFFSPPLV